MSGKTIEFSESDLAATAAAYDKAVHEAPIVVGHPASDDPAYGWVAGIAFADGVLTVTPDQIDPDFDALVGAGRFKKVSASFYEPDAPGNPAPGTYYLRHVGFLGAQPPAVKGLKPIAFADGEEGVIEFSDYADGMFVRVLRRMREFFIAECGTEKADAVLPGYEIDLLQEDAARVEVVAAFAEPASKSETPKEIDMSKTGKNELDARAEKLTHDEAAFAERETEMDARDAELKSGQAKLRLATATAFVEGLASEGRVPPGLADGLAAFCASLDDGQTLEFGEGDKAVKTGPAAFFKEFLRALPKQIDFAERSAEEGAGAVDAADPQALANAAVAYQEDMRGKGVEITADQAVRHVEKENAK